MRNTFLKTAFIFIFSAVLLLTVAGNAMAQNDSTIIRGFGLSMGLYQPELDYWKNDASSPFSNSDFSTTFFVEGFVEFRLVKDLAAKAGIGYWQARSETTIPTYGKTELLLNGYPISLDVRYYASPLQFAFVTPYIGAGGELVLISYQLDFEDKENPDSSNGSSVLGSATIGLQMKLSRNFAVDLFADYKFGNYQQAFIEEINNPDQPSAETEITHDISLSGPRLGISLKYLF
jgi:opacity protein-like surface antigen